MKEESLSLVPFITVRRSPKVPLLEDRVFTHSRDQQNIDRRFTMTWLLFHTPHFADLSCELLNLFAQADFFYLNTVIQLNNIYSRSTEKIFN